MRGNTFAATAALISCVCASVSEAAPAKKALAPQSMPAPTEPPEAAIPPPATPPAPTVQGQPFTYATAENRDIRYAVDEVLIHGVKGYLPKDKNWVQIHIVATNVGKRMVTLGGIKSKLSDNSVIASAQTATELAKPPSLSAEVGKDLGLGVAGTLAGAMLFPPLALVASAFSLVSSVGGSERWSKRLDRIRASELRPESVAPGTSTSGYVYVPATLNQTGLIAFYTVAGNVESVTLNRSAN